MTDCSEAGSVTDLRGLVIPLEVDNNSSAPSARIIFVASCLYTIKPNKHY